MMQSPPLPPPAAVGELVVKPARLPAAASDAAFSVIRIDPEELEAKTRLDQALGQAPGVSLFRRNSSLAANPTTQGVSLRSIAPSGAGRALVTLDGVPQNDPFGGWVIWASLPPELVEGVTIVRGGGAGPYGAGALTGVISIDERARDGVLLEGSFGSQDTQRGSAVLEGQAGRVNLLFAGSGSSSDGFIPVRAGSGAADTLMGLRDWNTALRANIDLGDSVLSVRVGAYDEQRGSGIGPGAADASGQSASVTLARAPTASAAGYRLQGWVRSSNLYNSTYSASATSIPPRSTPTLANIQYATPATGYGFNGALRGARAAYEWELGGDVRQSQGETREYIGPLTAGVLTKDRFAGGDALTAGLYAEGVWKPAEDLLVTGGARLDYWRDSNAHRIEHTRSTGAVTLNSPTADQDGYLPTARLGVRKTLDGYYLRSAAYVGFRPPSLNELHRPFRVGNDITEANPSLQPEKLYGAEAAFGRDAGNHAFSATVFYNQVTDAVTNVTIETKGAVGGTVVGFPQAGFIPAFGTLRQRQNAGTISAWGVEAELASKWTDTFTTRLAASWTDAEVDGGTAAPQLTGLRPAQAPVYTWTASAEWRATPALTLSSRARFEGDRFEDDLNSRILAPGGQIDLRAAYVVRKDAEVWVSADNILNKALATGQTADGTTSYASPRTFMVGLTIRR